ncbi:MAG: divergent PAP2 family protein [Candidatus Saccharimonadales bacterium]
MQKYQYLIAPLLGWVVAQSLKFIFSMRRQGLQWGEVVQSGGMPSSHTALTVALATVIGVNLGFDSAIFAVAATFAAVVIYDAMGVRRTTGEQTVAINELAKASKHKLTTKLDKARGHTPVEVVVGGLVGVAVGLITLAAF